MGRGREEGQGGTGNKEGQTIMYKISYEDILLNKKNIVNMF